MVRTVSQSKCLDIATFLRPAQNTQQNTQRMRPFLQISWQFFYNNNDNNNDNANDASLSKAYEEYLSMDPTLWANLRIQKRCRFSLPASESK